MTSLLTLEPHTGGLPYQLRAVPHAYEEAGRIQFKAMPGVSWQRDPASPNGRGYYVGAAEALQPVLATLEAAGVVKVRPAPSLEQLLVAAREHVFTPEEHQAQCESLARSCRQWPTFLRSYQKEGAAWVLLQLQQSRGALLADDMGIGKTIQAIAAADAFDLGIPRIVICPAIMRLKWRREIARWGSSLPSWWVGSYENFQAALRGKPSKGSEPLPTGDGPLDSTLLIIDEGHYLANPRSLRSKAVSAWRALHPQAPAIILTGTPIPTRVRDLWHLLDLLWPGRFGRKWDFEKRYCEGRFVEIPNTEKTIWEADGASRLDELRERLSHCCLARTKAEVKLELPPRTRSLIEVEIPKKALRDLQKAATFIDWSGGMSSAGKGISTLLSNVEAYKIEAAIALAQDVMAAGGRPLLLTTRKETARELGRALNCPAVDGDTPPDERQPALTGVPCAAATIYSVTTGIDLVDFDCIIMTGLDWQPSTLLQGEARIHRIGQDKPVTIYYLIGQHTVDEVVRERVIERLDVTSRVVGSDASEGLAGSLGAESDEMLLSALVAAVSEAA